MALTLLQLWEQQLTIYQAEQTSAQHDLAAAQVKLAAAGAQLAADQQELAKAEAGIAAARAQLAVTTIPADANALVAQITTLMIRQRGLQGSVLDDQDQAAEAQAAVDSATGTLAQANARVAGVNATIAAVTNDDARRHGYHTAIASPPLATLKADAAAFAASATVTHATSRIGKNFPSELLTIAHKRHDTRTNRVAGLQTDLFLAQNALGTESSTDGGLGGAAAQKRIAFERAQDALANYVATAASRFAKTQAVMSMLEAIELDTTNTIPDVLSDAERAQLTAMSAAGAAAEPTAETLDTAFNDVFTARDALDAQILTSIHSNVDGLAADADIAAKRAAVDAANTAFKNALSAFAASNKKDLDQWEAIIPDRAWQVLLDYQEALSALTYLSSTDPPALATAMDNAENDYAAALAAAAMAQRRADYLNDAITLRQERLSAAQGALAQRLPSAIRGDSY